MSSLHYFVVLAVLGSTLAFAGEFVPKSFYTIDEDGHKSDVVYLRKSAIPRFRRSARPSDAASYSHSASFAGPSSLSEIAGTVESGLSGTFQQLRSLQAQVESAGGGGGAGGGGHAYSGSFSSGGGGPGGQGAVLHSRFASTGGGSEREYVTGGNGAIRASANAQGPNGAFSSSRSSVGSDGQVHYNVNARQF